MQHPPGGTVMAALPRMRRQNRASLLNRCGQFLRPSLGDIGFGYLYDRLAVVLSPPSDEHPGLTVFGDAQNV